jgi:hypothetical protein
VSDTEWVYHGKRSWVQNPVGRQHRGWNTDFEPCPIAKKTAKRVLIVSPSLGCLWLNREVLERDGKVYHSRPHEYFYAVKPSVDPEKPTATRVPSNIQTAFSALGLTYPASKSAVTKAYKRKARQVHPDVGGQHEAFLELNKAFKTALQYV